MSPFENLPTLENYEQEIAKKVFSLPVIQRHLDVMNANLTQEGFDAEKPEEIKEAMQKTVQGIVHTVINKINTAVSSQDDNFRDIIVQRVDNLGSEFSETQDYRELQSELRIPYMRYLVGPGKQKEMGRRALIKNFELSFVLLFNIVAQSTLYTMNNIDIKYMEPTEEEREEMMRDIARHARRVEKINPDEGEKAIDEFIEGKKKGDKDLN